MAVKTIGATIEKGMTLLATATPSAATGVSFTNIPSGYKYLFLRWFGVYMSATNGYWSIRVNSDTGSNYAFHYASLVGATLLGGRSNVTKTSFGNTGDTSAVIPKTSATSTAYDQHGAGSLTIFDYTQTSLRKNIQSISWGDNSGNNILASNDGYYVPTGTAITSIDFVRSSTETITGTFYLYGVS
jgi:hypothetical protein